MPPAAPVDSVELPPRPGSLVDLRNRRAVVTSVRPSPVDERGVLHLVEVQYLDPDGSPTDSVVWEMEPGRRVHTQRSLPPVHDRDPMPPAELDAMVRAARWGALSPYVDPDGEAGPLDRQPLTAPLHGAVQIEDFQLVPLLKALAMPRVCLLLADDVGLGKTIEAGLVLSELMRRRSVRRILVLCPASLRTQWRDEMREKFQIEFDIVDRDSTRKLQQRIGLDANPWRTYSRVITSFDYLKQAQIFEAFRAVSEPDPNDPHLPWDLLVVDEAHHLTPAPLGGASDVAEMLRQLAPRFEHRLFLSATPHNGHTWSFTGLLETLDPTRFTQTDEMEAEDYERVAQVVVRRLKREVDEGRDPTRFARRELKNLVLRLSTPERRLAETVRELRLALRRVVAERPVSERTAGRFAVEVLGKRLLSSPAALADSWRRLRAGMGEQPAESRDVAVAAREAEAETGDDREAESRRGHAAATVGAWLVPFAGALNAAMADVDRAVEACVPADGGARSDARFDALCALIDERLRTGDAFRDDERLVVFTEYKTTLDDLYARLTQRYPEPGRVLQLYGGMSDAERDPIRAAFNDPAHSVRILLATDAASEGLNLQQTARYLLHYDIPWNPARLEQRNGRLDRHGQARDVTVWHFTSDDGSELAFLAYVAGKVDTMREDLGALEEVLDRAVEARLVEGADDAQVKADLDAGVAGERERGRYAADHSVGRDEVNRIEALRAEVELRPATLQATLATAMSGASGRALDGPDARGCCRLVMGAGLARQWQDVVDESVRDSQGRLPALVFDPGHFVRVEAGRQVFRPESGTSIVHLGHPLMIAARSHLARVRLAGAAEGHAVSRWTVTEGEIPAGADALLLLTIEELALNELREPFHHWVRSLAWPVSGGRLGERLPHEPAERWFAARARAVARTDASRDLWLDLEPAVTEQLRAHAADLGALLRAELATRLTSARAEEQERFRSRAFEIGRRAERTSIESLRRQIERVAAERRQLSLLRTEAEEDALLTRREELEARVRRMSAHFEELRGVLEREKPRILERLLPRRHALQGEPVVLPVALELRFPEAPR